MPLPAARSQVALPANFCSIDLKAVGQAAADPAAIRSPAGPAHGLRPDSKDPLGPAAAIGLAVLIDPADLAAVIDLVVLAMEIAPADLEMATDLAVLATAIGPTDLAMVTVPGAPEMATDLAVLATAIGPADLVAVTVPGAPVMATDLAVLATAIALAVPVMVTDLVAPAIDPTDPAAVIGPTIVPTEIPTGTITRTGATIAGLM